MKEKTIFVCNNCGNTSVKWYGRCPSCNEWNSLVEEKMVIEKHSHGSVRKELPNAQPIKNIKPLETPRFVLGMTELDAVLGGGIIPGSSILLGGIPGIGKSTILLQAAKMMADEHGTVLYITGEESAQQVYSRAQRLGALSDRLLLMAETNLSLALEAAQKHDVKMLIVDSVQALYLPELTSAPGSVSQVRSVAAACLEFARQQQAAVILVGHVTKEGMLAGPRVLEHMVDTVLYFEGDRYNSLRLLRAVKNRFGSTNELGVFEMGEGGLIPFADPSAFFLSQRPQDVPGSAVTCLMQGSRPLLLEVQALVCSTSFGNPRRLATGFDYNRLLLIIAVLERRLGLTLGSKDIYINIAGGLKAEDPAIDLAVAAAIVSSLKGVALAGDLCLLGEVGLLGEIRSVPQLSRRIKEGKAFGFTNVLLPQADKKELKEVKRVEGINVATFRDLPQALALLNLV
ncbi:MAG: DNA repair protein RadA [Bacillota bacterium]|jgi:DNA repair protein RadA/Sms